MKPVKLKKCVNSANRIFFRQLLIFAFCMKKHFISKQKGLLSTCHGVVPAYTIYTALHVFTMSNTHLR